MALKISLNGGNVVAVAAGGTYYIPTHAASFSLSNSTLTLFNNGTAVTFEASNDIQDKDDVTLASDAAVVAYLRQFVGVSFLDKAANATVTKVNTAITAVTLAAANLHRQKAIIVNNSAHKMYVKLGEVAPTTASFSYYRDASVKTEIVIEGFTGKITAIFDGSTGDAQVTEIHI